MRTDRASDCWGCRCILADDHPVAQLLVVLISGVGALDWGLVEMFDFNLLTQVGLGADMLTIAYIVVGLAGAVLLVDMLELDRVDADGLAHADHLSEKTSGSPATTR